MSEPVYIGELSDAIDSQDAARFMLNRYGTAHAVHVNSGAGGNKHSLTVEHARTFFAPCVPGMAVNWIDEVVAWAKTDRDGRQSSMFRILPPPACESRFGPCK